MMSDDLAGRKSQYWYFRTNGTSCEFVLGDVEPDSPLEINHSSRLSPWKLRSCFDNFHGVTMRFRSMGQGVSSSSSRRSSNTHNSSSSQVVAYALHCFGFLRISLTTTTSTTASFNILNNVHLCRHTTGLEFCSRSSYTDSRVRL